MRFRTFRHRASSWAFPALIAVGALFFSASANAYQVTIGANADAMITKPGDASITLPIGPGGSGVAIPLEGAEFSAPGTDPHYPLTAAEVTRLNALAPNLGLVSVKLAWVNAHGIVVNGPGGHAVNQVAIPVLNTTPNFDTVIQRMNDVSFTAAGQVQETKIRVLMLNLQSVVPVVIGGFHYELLAVLANGSPVFDPTDAAHPQFTGNIKFDSTAVSPGAASGTLDLGVTGPTPTSANLGADLPAGMEALPVNFDIQFIPLDNGPAINDNRQEVIFTNTGPSSFASVPEPSSVVLLLTSGLIAGTFAAWKRRAI